MTAEGVGMSSTKVLHESVAVDPWTLRFHSQALESEYRDSRAARQRIVWGRALLASVAFQLLFLWQDTLEHSTTLYISAPLRLGVCVLQLTGWLLVKLGLVGAWQRLVLIDTALFGVVTIALHVCQLETAVTPSSAVFVSYGIAFYITPRISPCYYFHAVVGSVGLVALYLALALFVRPYEHAADLAISLLYLLPATALFNWVSRTTEKDSRERFLLRRRLQQERVNIRFDTKALAPRDNDSARGAHPAKQIASHLLRRATSGGHRRDVSPERKRTLYAKALLAWLLFSLGGWVSLPQGLRLVDEATAVAGLSHLVGFTVFLLLVTQQMRWLLVNSVLGLTVVWVLSLAAPHGWTYFAANSVGYVVLATTVTIAFGVFGGLLKVWHELVEFARRAVQTVPGLSYQLRAAHPMLKRLLGAGDASNEDETAARHDAATSKRGLRGRQAKRGAKHRNKGKLASAGDTATPRLVLTLEGPMQLEVADSCETGHTCYMCRGGDAPYLLPVCRCWAEFHAHRATLASIAAKSAEKRLRGADLAIAPDDLTTNDAAATFVPAASSMCTPYADLKAEVEGLRASAKALRDELERSKAAEAAALVKAARSDTERLSERDDFLAQISSLKKVTQDVVDNHDKTVRVLLSDLNAAQRRSAIGDS